MAHPLILSVGQHAWIRPLLAMMMTVVLLASLMLERSMQCSKSFELFLLWSISTQSCPLSSNYTMVHSVQFRRKALFAQTFTICTIDRFFFFWSGRDWYLPYNWRDSTLKVSRKGDGDDKQDNIYNQGWPIKYGDDGENYKADDDYHDLTKVSHV